ncbi:hypothetical protein M3Y97_01101400 [Aphelenchoides bicaudatus]|nr:hypothetical protein M3Y97_01101400 [Aphelenchoides bicaudatus]
MVSLADKNEYLKKYLSPAETDKKKKKKPKKSHGSGFNIEEDDAFAKVSVGASSSALQRYLDGEASDPDSENDMVITGVTKSGAFLAGSFQTVGDESSSSFKSIKIEAPDSGDEQVAETTREDLSPPRRRRHDSNEKPRDLSPPRRRRHDSNNKA